jgi:hypothetical protein
MSDALPTRWQSRPDAENAVALSPAACEIASTSILELTRSDRVAGETPVSALTVEPQSVQLVLTCPVDVLHQRVGRLKSRMLRLL